MTQISVRVSVGAGTNHVPTNKNLISYTISGWYLAGVKPKLNYFAHYKNGNKVSCESSRQVVPTTKNKITRRCRCEDNCIYYRDQGVLVENRPL